MVTYLLEDILAGQFELDRGHRHEVLHSQRRDLHDVPDVQAIDPLRLVQIAQQVLHVGLLTAAPLLLLADACLAGRLVFLIFGRDPRVVVLVSHLLPQGSKNGHYFNGCFFEQ